MWCTVVLWYGVCGFMSKPELRSFVRVPFRATKYKDRELTTNLPK